MHSHHGWGFAAAILMIGALPTFGQTARQITAHTKTLGPGLYGASTTQVGDWTGDNVSEYAVGTPFSTLGGLQAGLVEVFDGASGVAIRTRVGASVTSCFGSVAGDQLGSDVVDIADLDGDGRRELLVTRPGAPLFVGGCFQAGHGGFLIVHSNPATPDFVFTAAAQNGLGKAATGLDSLGGVALFAVSRTTGTVEVWQKANPSLPPSLLSTVTTFAMQADVLCSAGSPGGTPAFAADAAGDQVFVRSILGASVQVIAGPFGSNFGSTLAALNEPGLPHAIVIGAPLFLGNDGMIQVVDANGIVVTQMTGFPTSGERLGEVVGSGGDVNGDGDQDFVAFSSQGDEILIADRNGVRTKRPIFLPAGVSATALDVVPDMQGNGSAEVLVGAAPSNQSWIYQGGPDASVVSVGNSCNQGTPFLPNLGLNADPIIGTAPSFGQFGASPLSFSAMLAGTIDPVGTVIPPGTCLVHLQLNPPPITGFSTLTDASGAWVTSPVFIPAGPGQQFAFQAITISGLPGFPLEFSNAVNLTLGW